jgi:putative ABC transport system permease protein
MRKVLITTQIGACAAAFLCSLMMRNAMNDLKTKDIGFNSRNLIFFQLDDKELVERYPAFKKEILRIPGVSHMTASNFVPWRHGLMHSLAYYNDDAFLRALTMYVDPSFIETYQIPIIDGEGFSTKWTEMPGYVIINETARKILQSAGSDPLSKVIDIPYDKSFWPHQTLGIMRDFNYFYPTERIKPLAILPSYHIRYVRNYVTIRLADGSHSPILAKIETAVKRFFPHTQFEYKYVAEEMEKMHTQAMGYHWIAFVVVNGFLLLIAVAGLSGYAAYEINRCTREIGIRKAFGAKAVHIVLHFFLRFAKLVLIANAIAWPICYFAIQRILVIIDYPHPIRISFIHFLMAGIFTMFFTIATVWVQVYRAALIDPAETLRYENNE